MSHLHIPDGVLPWWLIVAGWAVLIVWVGIICRIYRGSASRRVARIGVVSAFMLIAMSLEIVPLAYHFNLSIIAGALLGCALSPVAAVIVVTFLALMGHGGVTVIGLNALVLSCELCLGSLLFRVLRGSATGPGRCGVAGTLAVLITLPITTAATLGLTALGMDVGNLPRVIVTLGPIGWAAEAALTGLTLSWIARVRPSLLDRKHRRTGA
ncbi:MAG: energy-coupling factor ABC transporter permease [Actinomycetes bacterium]|jgi:cobalt/nickel transport system permease protein|nr:energy-coupling factor ABC transporter permease [Actinomycetes bacterium]